jgi:hypothetical protein
MLVIDWTKFLPTCIPLALAACGGRSQTEAQITAVDQKADQAMLTPQQASSGRIGERKN